MTQGNKSGWYTQETVTERINAEQLVGSLTHHAKETAIVEEQKSVNNLKVCQQSVKKIDNKL